MIVQNYLDRFQRLLELIVAGLFIALFLVLVANIVLRNLGGVALMWIPGLTRLIFIWMIFLGIAIAYRRNEHLGIDLLLLRLSKKKRHLLLLVIHSLMIPFFAVLLYYGIEVAKVRMGVPFPAWWMPTGYAYIAVPLGGALLLIFGFEQIIQHFKEVRSS